MSKKLINRHEAVVDEMLEGIHGEPGVRRAALTSADQLTETLVETILSARELCSRERIVRWLTT